MIKAVIFDVDGTLLDTEPIYLWAWREAGKHYGKVLTDEVLMRTRGVNIKESIPIFKECMGEDFDYHKARVIRERLAEECISRDGVATKPYVREILQYLKDNGIRRAVASSTNTEMTYSHLRAAGIEQWIEVFVGGDKVENGKPILVPDMVPVHETSEKQVYAVLKTLGELPQVIEEINHSDQSRK